MAIQTIQFGDEGQVATRELIRRCEALAPLHLGAHATVLRQLGTLESLERQYGGFARLELEDAAELVAALHTQMAHWEAEAGRRKLLAHEEISVLAIGVALWAIRHGVDIEVVEPVANALAWRSNHAKSKQDLAAVFGLMQGIIAHVAPRLAHDLERSNPERPWRLLHVNFAITAIRTEDPALMDHAFDALDAALPDERSAFYSEALALVLAPGIAPAVRSCIEARHARWLR
jgi:hypothetical protein